jgi:hypothetical protein
MLEKGMNECRGIGRNKLKESIERQFIGGNLFKAIYSSFTYITYAFTFTYYIHIHYIH